MANRLPPLNAIRTFEVAARHLNFTKAAEELFVTQAAVSHQIKSLEEHLGLKLFVRKNRNLLLTEEGQAYYADLRIIFTELTEATERLLALGEKGTLTVCLTPSFAIEWLVPRLNDFSILQPQIDVRIKAVDKDEHTLTEDVDIAIYYGRGNWKQVDAQKLLREYFIPVCSPNIITAQKPLTNAYDLQQHNLLHDHSRKNWKLWSKSIENIHLNTNKGPIFSHSSMVLQAAIYGQGVALMNSILVRPDLESGRLICPIKHYIKSKSAYYVVCRSHQSQIGKIAAFRDWLISTINQEKISLQQLETE